MLRRLHSLTVCFGVLGFLLQSIAGATGARSALCVGCDQTWLTVSVPCDPVADLDYCDDAEPQSQLPFDPHQPRLHGQDDCACVDVPLPARAEFAMTAARADPSNHLSAHAPAPLMASWPEWKTTHARETRAECGPRPPPGSVLPQPRCTVLVI